MQDTNDSVPKQYPNFGYRLRMAQARAAELQKQTQDSNYAINLCVNLVDDLADLIRHLRENFQACQVLTHLDDLQKLMHTIRSAPQAGLQEVRFVQELALSLAERVPPSYKFKPEKSSKVKSATDFLREFVIDQGGLSEKYYVEARKEQRPVKGLRYMRSWVFDREGFCGPLKQDSYCSQVRTLHRSSEFAYRKEILGHYAKYPHLRSAFNQAIQFSKSSVGNHNDHVNAVISTPVLPRNPSRGLRYFFSKLFNTQYHRNLDLALKNFSNAFSKPSRELPKEQQGLKTTGYDGFPVASSCENGLNTPDALGVCSSPVDASSLDADVHTSRTTTPPLSIVVSSTPQTKQDLLKAAMADSLTMPAMQQVMSCKVQSNQRQCVRPSTTPAAFYSAQARHAGQSGQLLSINVDNLDGRETPPLVPDGFGSPTATG